MKKIIAIVLSICILIASEAPVLAQVPLAGRTARQLSKIEKSFAIRSFKAPKTPFFITSEATLRRMTQTTPSAVIALRPPQNTAELHLRVERSVQNAIISSTMSPEKISTLAKQGKTFGLPSSILKFKNPAQRSPLLRNEFVTAAADGNASLPELTTAQKFWRYELTMMQPFMQSIPSLTSASNEMVLPVVYTLQDAAALALLGDLSDKALLQKITQQTRDSSLTQVTSTLWTRYLLAQQEWGELEQFFVTNDGQFAALQNSMAQYAKENNLPLTIFSTEQPEKPLAPQVKDLLQDRGVVVESTTDPSIQATRRWMEWYQNRSVANTENAVAQETHQQQPATVSTIIPNLTTNTADVLDAFTTQALQTRLVTIPARTVASVPSGKTAAAVPQAAAANTVSATAVNNTSGNPANPPVNPSTQEATRLTSGGGGNNNLPPSAKPPLDPEGNSLLARFQRASLYAASFVMGLEVATPVIANFGSSFGLSLQDNILVSVATYTPYSLGALLSNQVKKYLGRKGSMNLGLLMMATGFAGGVTWAGLDGAFTPHADTMMQFYKALACITLASTGGVFVHNSVGPIMTELNAKASELVRQKRSAMTEFSRALGMASSFAFPFIATKMMGMDWSFTFALPIPLVAASLLGVNLIHLPNTRPIVNHAAHATAKAKNGLLNWLKNNEYVRLFKEEKGAGPLLAGLAIMNGVEMGINNGFLLLLPSLTKDPSSQYLFGMAQFAAPFILGRYLAKKFLNWFPKRNLTVATGMATAGASAAIMPGIVDNVYALTGALFLAETGISSLFTLSFARTAKNPATVDRLTTLIVASALSCAVGPMIFSSITQGLVNAGLGLETATAAAMIGIPAGLTILASRLFRRVEKVGVETKSSISKLVSFIKESISFPKFRRKRS